MSKSADFIKLVNDIINAVDDYHQYKNQAEHARKQAHNLHGKIQYTIAHAGDITTDHSRLQELEEYKNRALKKTTHQLASISKHCLVAVQAFYELYGEFQAKPNNPRERDKKLLQEKISKLSHQLQAHYKRLLHQGCKEEAEELHALLMVFKCIELEWNTNKNRVYHYCRMIAELYPNTVDDAVAKPHNQSSAESILVSLKIILWNKPLLRSQMAAAVTTIEQNSSLYEQSGYVLLTLAESNDMLVNRMSTMSRADVIELGQTRDELSNNATQWLTNAQRNTSLHSNPLVRAAMKSSVKAVAEASLSEDDQKRGTLNKLDVNRPTYSKLPPAFQRKPSTSAKPALPRKDAKPKIRRSNGLHNALPQFATSPTLKREPSVNSASGDPVTPGRRWR